MNDARLKEIIRHAEMRADDYGRMADGKLGDIKASCLYIVEAINRGDTTISHIKQKVFSMLTDIELYDNYDNMQYNCNYTAKELKETSDGEH